MDKRQNYSKTYVVFGEPDQKSSRHFRVFSSMRNVFVKFENMTGTFKWNSIHAVRLLRNTEATGVLEIELKVPLNLQHSANITHLRFGTVPNDCWRKVVAAFDGKLMTEVVE